MPMISTAHGHSNALPVFERRQHRGHGGADRSMNIGQKFWHMESTSAA